MSSFRMHATISCADLHAAADPSARLVDFQQHCLGELTQTVMARKAACMGCAIGNVCWIIETPYEVVEGGRLSASATLSSRECCASFAVHFLASRLELTLISAAAEIQVPGAHNPP